MTRTARGGPARWAYAAVVVLGAALALLVHHGVTAAPVAVSSSSLHASSLHATPLHATPGHAVPGAVAPPHTMMTTGAGAERTRARPVGPAVDSAGDGACAATGTQHCSTASVDTLKLPPPPRCRAEQAPCPHRAVTGRKAARTIGRAPPDLSVLSRLRA